MILRLRDNDIKIKGYRGKTCLFIDYQVGNVVRLVAVTTNAPLEKTEKQARESLNLTIAAVSLSTHHCFQYFKEHHGKCIVNRY